MLRLRPSAGVVALQQFLNEKFRTSAALDRVSIWGTGSGFSLTSFPRTFAHIRRAPWGNPATGFRPLAEDPEAAGIKSLFLAFFNIFFFASLAHPPRQVLCMQLL